jgi:two-component system LytT family sensor kinase
VSGSFHLPTAIFVAGAMVLLYALVRLVRHGRQASQGFVSEVDHATHATLHTASMAARHLQDGLTAEGTAKAAKHLRELLGSAAVAVCDSSGLLAWDGAPEHHAAEAPRHAEEVLRTGRTIVLRAGQVQCADPDCPARTVVIAPVVTDERVVAAIAAYGPHASAGLARATEEVAGWMATQAELADLGHQRTRTMEAELRALRAQISPHFIYNSLAAIASFVRTDPERARELLLEFADFTRYSFRRHGEFTTLAEELGSIEQYLVLEQARFGDRLDVTLRIAPEVLPVVVPFLSLQPLVENAVRHGLAGKDGQGRISITAVDQDFEAVISVEDDGLGEDPERVRRALAGDTTTDSVGLGNVDERLRSTFGDDYGLVVETAPGAGTKVTVRVPKYAPGVHA